MNETLQFVIPHPIPRHGMLDLLVDTDPSGVISGPRGADNTGQGRYNPKVPPVSITYDHIHKRTRDPVRSPLDKLVRAKLVLRSVTTGESLVLYVMLFLLLQIDYGYTSIYFSVDSFLP